MILVCKFFVTGRPAPQGSKASLGKGRFKEQSPYLDAWRNDVRAAAEKVRGEALINGPIFTRMTFHFPRPKAHYVAGNRERGLKPTAPVFYSSAPDRDKLERSTNDALTGVIWVDDARVAGTYSFKLYSCELSGASIRVYQLTDDDALKVIEKN